MDKGQGWNKSQRMQMKAFICILGLALIFLLLLGRIFLVYLHRNRDSQYDKHIPVIEELSNVWIMEADSEKIMIFRDGVEEAYYYGDKEVVYDESVREQVADITLSDGSVTKIAVKQDKINGKILSADSEGVELEGYGKICLAPDYKGYRVYNTLESCSVSDLPFGYDFADFVMEDGKICAILLAKENAMEYIRVLIKASDYSALLHEELVFTVDSDFALEYGAYDNRKVEEHLAGEEIVINSHSEYLSQGRVRILPKVITGRITLKNVNRNQGAPSYRGNIELVQDHEGIAVINEVTLEEYLYSVVPSEMPSSYPKEALKVQAICARTYAYGHMLHAGYPEYGAHVDDSTSYQVYNNILEQGSTTTAAKETYGQLLYTEDGELAGTYYYSTSCGVGTDAKVWKTEASQNIDYLQSKAFNKKDMQKFVMNPKDYDAEEVDVGEELREEAAFVEFITSVREDDFEAAEGWYRWSYHVDRVDVNHIVEVLKKRYSANSNLVLTLQDDEFISKPIESFDTISELYVATRGSGGVADELILKTNKGVYKVVTEHNIRYVLNDGKSNVRRQDGSEIASPNLLPSGFFMLEPIQEDGLVMGYVLTGGGFGHGVGMSQNGAKSMAQCGYTAEQILLFYYENCKVKNIYQE